MYSIKQNGKTILSSPCNLMMFFNNLTGKNIKGEDYKLYIKGIAYKEMGFVAGEIEMYKDEHLQITGNIPQY